ncbi:MAG: glycosyltransferase family 2 protein [Candidatus Cloacimonadota bacterium]|nr:MAG: glycosyltransferase family 2 protein [Candidatus Cloacimonadota bacterium]
MKLSVIIPVYNEINCIENVISRVKKVKVEKEIIVVDDCSTDGTREILEKIEGITLLLHDRNRGKGAAVRTALKKVSGDIVIIQDADLEYPPEQYPEVIKPIVDGYADVVFGSRFLGLHRVFYFWHYMGNRFLTILTNLLYDTILTDMETGVKAFRKEVFNSITIKSNGFDFEPEITAKVLKKGFRLYEMPITYYGRGYEEGKKITWKDAIPAIWAIVKYRFVD